MFSPESQSVCLIKHFDNIRNKANLYCETAEPYSENFDLGKGMISRVVLTSLRLDFLYNSNIAVTSHNGQGISNQRWLDCLFNSFFRPTTKTHQNSALLVRCEEKSPVTGSPHTGPLMRKASPCGDVIVKTQCTSMKVKPGGITTLRWHLMRALYTRLSNSSAGQHTRAQRTWPVIHSFQVSIFKNSLKTDQ